MGILVRDGSVWKDSEPYVKHGGVWKPVDTGFVRDAGVWKEMYSSGLLLEGSWEDGWEGWVDTSSPYPANRVQNYNRTGQWGVELNPGPPFSGYTYTLEYTVPSQMATEFVRCSVWFIGQNSRQLRARIGSGPWFVVAERAGSSEWSIAEGLVHNPLRQAVTFQIFAEGGVSGNGCDDWRIEGYNDNTTRVTGSWETGLEGWELTTINPPYGVASRVSDGARTGDWALSLGGVSGGGGMATYSLPDNPKFVKMSVWVNTSGSATLRYKLGNGEWTIFATNTGTSGYRELSGAFSNPDGLPVTVQIHQQGGSGVRFDDWNIEVGN